MVIHHSTLAASVQAFKRRRRKRGPSLFLFGLTCAALQGGLACSEGDTLPSPLPAADLTAPPADASGEAATDGTAATDAPADGGGDGSEGS